MAQDITDANSVVVSIGSTQAGGASGKLILDEFEFSINTNDERRHGVGNADAQGYVTGNREYDLSFTHIGESEELAEEMEQGNFDVALEGEQYKYEANDVRPSDYTVSVSDGGDYEMDFNGMTLTFDRVSV
jgi:hypothetical protein